MDFKLSSAFSLILVYFAIAFPNSASVIQDFSFMISFVFLPQNILMDQGHLVSGHLEWAVSDTIPESMTLSLYLALGVFGHCCNNLGMLH